MLRAAAAQLRRELDRAERGRWAVRRLRWIARLRLAAERVYADLDVDVAPDVRLGRRVRVVFDANTANRISIGAGTVIDDDVFIRLAGGSVDIGPRVVVRRGAVFNVAGGDLVLRGDNLVSWGTTIHCSSRVELDEMVVAAEHVTIADAGHFWTTPDAHHWHNVKTGDVYVGRNTWLCPKSTLTPGAHVGACCLVASNSVVTGSVPDGSFAGGVPATVRPNAVPWRGDEGGPEHE
jgi:acetyltransferase-like isoleucine patch superfamily enzyme